MIPSRALQSLHRFARHQKPCNAVIRTASRIAQHPANSHHHHHDDQHTNQTVRHLVPFVLPAGLFSFLSPRKDESEETPEGKLIMCLKRSILCMQRQQYDKAEQMLHLALRMAQDQQNKQGITYVFDVMANLAMEMGQFAKAERLFVAVMQRLLQEGYKDDDIKMLHMSSKIAHMKSLQGHLATAEIGFKWVLDKVQLQLKQLSDDSGEVRANLQELYGLTKDCYAQLLIKLQRFAEAKQQFGEALALYSEMHGREQPEVVAILNNLAVVCTNLNDLVGAEAYINEALRLAEKFPELYESGVYQANRGMLLLRQGLLDEAQRVCEAAWRSAKRSKSADGVEQSDHCLKELRRLRVA